MQTSLFDYDLPRRLIAQRPLEHRDDSRLLQLDRADGAVADQAFRDFPNLLRGDELLVLNNVRVLPARLFGKRAGAHSAGTSRSRQTEHLTGTVEVFLTRQIEGNVWEALVRPGRKIPPGERIVFGAGVLEAEITARGERGLRTLRFLSNDQHSPEWHVERIGHVPLPPYIQREDETSDRERYQTVFARTPGAVAAPTAGLHFTAEILQRVQERGCEISEITLNVGLGTFQPVHTETLEEYTIHSESYEIGEEAARKVASAKRERRPVLAIGTTVVRALEDSARRAREAGAEGPIRAGRAEAQIFITPGYAFEVVDALLTNFHLPKSTLLALVSAFAGRENVLAAYRHAVLRQYRFYSYGDCMLIR